MIIYSTVTSKVECSFEIVSAWLLYSRNFSPSVSVGSLL